MQRRILRSEYIFARKCIEKLRLDKIGTKVIRKDDMKIDTLKMALAATKLIKTQFDNGQKQINVLKMSGSLFLEYAPIAIQEDVVIDSNNLKFRRQIV